MGAKNHAVIMPDGKILWIWVLFISSPANLANINHTLNAITGAAFGAAGQRCMAISVAVLVGDAKEFLPALIERASKLRVNGGFEPNTDLYVFFLPRSRY